MVLAEDRSLGCGCMITLHVSKTLNGDLSLTPEIDYCYYHKKGYDIMHSLVTGAETKLLITVEGEKT